MTILKFGLNYKIQTLPERIFDIGCFNNNYNMNYADDTETVDVIYVFIMRRICIS